MQTRAIKKKLHDELKSWVDSLEDGPRHTPGSAALIRDQINSQGVVIAGGAIVSLLLDQEPKDYDLFFPTLDIRNTVYNYYTHCYSAELTKGATTRINNRGEIVLDEQAHALGYVINEEGQAGTYDPKIITRNAITLNNKIQLVTRQYGYKTQILNSFDFAHTKVAYSYPTNELYLDKAALESILTKELRYGESQYPIAALMRAHRFMRRGFDFPLPELLKIAVQINALDLTDKEVILDQLTGISAGVALGFVQKLTEKEDETGLNLLDKKDNKDNFEVFCELIDEFFNEANNINLETAWDGV
jgi:hypothetical protein